jgi:competence protein ComEC
MLASHKGEIPFVVYLLPFLAGIALALTFNTAGYQALIIISFFILLAGFIALNLFYQQTNLHKTKWVGGILSHILLVLAGAACVLNYDSRNRDTYFARYPADMLLVKVNSEPQFKNNFLRFTAVAEQGDNKSIKRGLSGTLLLIMRTDSAHAQAVNYGDELLIPAKYNPIDPPFNPAEFNYQQYLAHQDIYMQAFVNPQDVLVVNRGAGNPVIAYALQLRQKLVRQFKQHLHSPEAIAVASTLILGYKAELDNDILQAYSKTGTIHVLSVSGAHVAIIFLMIGWLLGFMDRWKHGRVFKAILTIAIIWYYALLTGLSPPVCRAAVMISMIIIGKTYNRRINSLNILGVSAFAILLSDPFLITDVGFQLSYLAVGGLIVFQPIVYHWLEIENKWLDKLWLYCSASIAAQAITFPLSAYYFHQFPVCFLLSNLFILLPSFIIMCAGITYLVVAQTGVPVLIKPVAYVLEHTILIMNKGLHIIEQSPYASMGKIWISRGECVLLFAIMILVFGLCYYKKPGLLKIVLGLILILSISLSAKRIAGMRSDNITFFNLKKHSAILFKQGSKAVLITDLADTDKVYRYSIQPCLDSGRVEDVVVIPFNRDTVTAFMAKRGQLIRFLDKDMVIISQVTPIDFPFKVKADYLFVTGNPHGSANKINRLYDYTTLVVDAGNSDKTLSLLQSAIKKDDKKMYLLKRNKSLIIQSE